MAGVKDPESVAEHSWRTSLIASLIAKPEGADPAQAAYLAVWHDTQETRTGDVNYVGKKYAPAGDPQERRPAPPLPPRAGPHGSRTRTRFRIRGPPGSGLARFSLAARAPIRRSDPGPACHRPRTADGGTQPALGAVAARDDLPHRQTARRHRDAGGTVHRSVTEPALRPRRLQALSGRPLERRLQQRLEAMGGDRATRLQGQLPARSRLCARQAHLTAAGVCPTALSPNRRGELGRCRRPCQPDQNTQASDLWPRWLLAAA